MDEFVNWVLGLWMCPLLTPTWDVHFWRAEKILLPGTQKRYQINCVLWDWILRVIDWVPPRFASAWLPMKNINWRKLNAHKSYLRWYDIYILIWYGHAVWLRVQVHSSLTHPFEVASTMANGNMASSMGSGFIAQLEARRCRLWTWWDNVRMLWDMIWKQMLHLFSTQTFRDMLPCFFFLEETGQIGITWVPRHQKTY